MEKKSLALTAINNNLIVSSSYITFDINDKEKILPEFLYLWFCRPEFDRYARFNSWGSAREAFSFADMKTLQKYLFLPLTSNVQSSIYTNVQTKQSK